jgi:PIN domain nuclease of toxin-antitoxin system
MRVLLDTHIFIWYAKEQEKLSKDVLTIHRSV